MANILVLTDNERLLSFLEFALTVYHHKVVACKNPASALSELQNCSFHAAIIDEEMPRVNIEPLGGVHSRFVTAQLSVAVMVQVTLLLLHSPGSVGNSRFAGQPICGAS